MIPLILTVDKKTIANIIKVLTNANDSSSFIMGVDHPEVIGMENAICQLTKQLNDSEMVCPIQKLANKD